MPKPKRIEPDLLKWKRELERDRVAAALGQPIRPAAYATRSATDSRSDDPQKQDRWRRELERDRVASSVMAPGRPFPGPGADAGAAPPAEAGAETPQNEGEDKKAVLKKIAADALKKQIFLWILAALPYILLAVVALVLVGFLGACWSAKVSCAIDMGRGIAGTIIAGMFGS